MRRPHEMHERQAPNSSNGWEICEVFLGALGLRRGDFVQGGVLTMSTAGDGNPLGIEAVLPGEDIQDGAPLFGVPPGAFVVLPSTAQPVPPVPLDLPADPRVRRFAVDDSGSAVHDRESMGELDREGLRQQLNHLTEVDRRIVLERVVEHLAEADIRRLLEGFVHFEGRPDNHPSHTLLDRVRAQSRATRRGAYQGKYVLRNAHGQREPRETALWESVTAHLFDLVHERASKTWDEHVSTCAMALVDLVDEVDEMCEDLVVFEDRCARERFAIEQERLRLRVAARAASDAAG